MRSSKISKIEAISFLKSHFSSYLLDSSSHNQYTRISFHVDDNTTTYDSCTAKEDNFVCKDDSKDLFTQEIQGFIETIMTYLVFPTAELSHTMHFSGMSLTTAPTTGCPHSKDQAHLDGNRIQLPNHLKKMLDLSRRTYLSDLLNQEIFKILGVNNNISSLLHILNDQFCLQEEISERLKIKVENTRKMFFSTCVGLT